MREYEQTQTIDATADEAFAWLSDVSNLPKYLPPVIDASIEGPSAGDNPGRRVRATLEYPGERGGTFDAQGYLAVDEGRRRMEWGGGGRARLPGLAGSRRWCQRREPSDGAPELRGALRGAGGQGTHARGARSPGGGDLGDA
jgi:hypothetical protein